MTTELLMGNEAFAHAALEAGVRVVAGYPGTPSSELVETVAKLHAAGKAEGVHVEWSTNEKAALELLAGAAYAGARVLFTCKQVGLNVASDALMSLNYVGVNGGTVLFVADDPGPISSQTEQDTRRFASFAKVPVLDPATPEQGFAMMQAAFELSERYRTPVIVRPTTRICHASTFFEVADVTHAQPVPPEGFVRDPRYVIFPPRAYAGHGEINDRLAAMAQDFAEDPAFARFNPLWMGGALGAEDSEECEACDQALEATGEEGITPDEMPEETGAQEVSAPGVSPERNPAQATPQLLDELAAEERPYFGIAAGGVSCQYVREALRELDRRAHEAGLPLPRYALWQVGTPFPFPAQLGRAFLENVVGEVIVFEELDHVIEDELLMALGREGLAGPRIHGKRDGATRNRGENSTEDALVRLASFFELPQLALPTAQERNESLAPLAQVVPAIVKKSEALPTLYRITADAWRRNTGRTTGAENATDAPTTGAPATGPAATEAADAPASPAAAAASKVAADSDTGRDAADAPAPHVPDQRIPSLEDAADALLAQEQLAPEPQTPHQALGAAEAVQAGLKAAARAGTDLFAYQAPDDDPLPVRPPVLCAGCPHRGSFYAVKRALKALGNLPAVLCGDIGCYTLGNAMPLDAVDTCLCMGAGITMAQGLSVADPAKKALAFVGDSTFFASAMTGIANAAYNGHDVTFCILDNATTAMTGSQPHPGTGVTLMGERRKPLSIPRVLAALGVECVAEANPLDLEASIAAVQKAVAFEGPSAVIFTSPCVQLFKPGAPARVNPEVCTGCKKCVTEIGCPGIGFRADAKGPKSGKRGQAFVDASLCNGCGLCVQVCPFGALAIPETSETE